MAGDAQVQRLLVLGSGYSGTTLLAMGLATSQQVLAAGEVPMYSRANPDRDPCTCGATFGTCRLWSAVFAAGQASQSAAMEDAVRSLRERAAAIEPQLSWLIDSGKTAQDGLRAHLELGSHDLRAIHLVRHPAAVAHSSLFRGDTLDAAVERWVAVQAATLAALEAAAIPSLRLRYEDLTADFARGLQRVGTWLGVPGPFGERAEPWRWQDADWSARNHIMASNPRRFAGRPEQVAAEEGFRFALGADVVADVVRRAGTLAQQLGYAD
ncbi:MAG TPA: sulfotransferase [Polyangiales bacterium]|nr:sulfotransferase [Polyangiales bacterium]